MPEQLQAKCSCGATFASPSQAAEHFYATDHKIGWSIPGSWLKDRPWDLEGMFTAIRAEFEDVRKRAEEQRAEVNDDPSFLLLAEACRVSDAQAEEHGADGYLTKLGFSTEATVQCCEQRAARALLAVKAFEGNAEAIETLAALARGEAAALMLTAEEHAQIPTLALAILDGISIGLTARELRDNSRQGDDDGS